jgi:23S rRNA pseudouridine1911/1915/1917 synthase
MQPEVIWQDEFLAVLSKPAGMVVNTADSVKSYTVQEWAREQWGQEAAWQESMTSDTFAEREGMVHRLDKDTSGVLLWAKNIDVLEKLLSDFQSRVVHKTYLALVHGKLPEQKGVVNAPIERNPQNRTKFSVTNQGRESETEFAVVHEFAPITSADLKKIAAQKGVDLGAVAGTARNLYQGGFSLVELHPKTGRTHQIRVHMDYLHHPLVGDERYAGRKRARLDHVWCPRQWLHAWKIGFVHPVTGESMEFAAPIPEDLDSALKVLDSEFTLEEN